jgi:hypothetical protein
MADTPTLARFVHGYVLDGTSPDGLPLYRDIVQIYLSRPPYLEVTREATEQDQADYAHPWQLFQREEKGRKVDAREGYPLVMWPAVSPSEVRMCADREIYTVEQLAQLAVKAGAEIPAQIVELAKRAKRMIELSRETGRHEARVTELEGQIGALREENNELKAKNEAQRITIGTMAARQAA